MSYPRDLDEYSDYEILKEYRRRADLLRESKCTYCTRPQAECACRMQHAHGHGLTSGSLPFTYSEFCVKFNSVKWPPADGVKVNLEIIR